jgi:predicted O-methyltransferase YrrM
MFSDKEKLNETLNISKHVANTMIGNDCPQFKRIRHFHHHITLYIKDHIMKEDCRNYLEIGTHYGHSFATMLHSKYKSRYMAIDLFKPWGDGQIANMEKVASDNAKKYNVNNYDSKVIKGNSSNIETLEKVKEFFPDGIDLLFIDGDHSYDGITKDFNMYFPLVNKNGYIVFDDYLPIQQPATNAIDNIVNNYKDEINDIGLIDDIIEVWKTKSKTEIRDKNGICKNIDYIIQKK